MNPIYKFQLSANGGESRRAYPSYKEDLSKDFEKEQGEEFYRAKLSGKLTFMSEDYKFIADAAFDTRFGVEILISYDAGATWSSYWSGRFWKTDCEIDEDTQTVEVEPEVYDEYSDILAGMEHEYNLLDLLPEIEQLTVTKRPMIQIYVPGQTVVGCFLSGMYWEQDCDAVDNDSDLTRKYYFAKCASQRLVEIDGDPSITLPPVFTGKVPATYLTDWSYTKDGYRVSFAYDTSTGTAKSIWTISTVADSKVLWQYEETGVTPSSSSYRVTLSPVVSGTTGEVTLYVHDLNVYGRYITDSDTVAGISTYAIPSDDIVDNNRNYHRVIGYAFKDVIYFSDRLTESPTKWGIFQPGQYYEQPYSVYNPTFFPVAKSAWGRVSVWFSFSALDWLTERQGRKEYTLKDAYPLSSVISVLLGKIAQGVMHEGTTDYSRFLYGVNPLTSTDYRLYITPKSNILAGNYDQPAQKAPITLKQVTDMLRDCFRCYWFVEGGKFRVEHIKYFQGGGTYDGVPVISRDLTTETVTRNGKSWAFARGQYSFDKPEMPARYQFGWMDDVTELFEGKPIEMVSGYVQADEVEDVTVTNFTSDVDYMLLNPSACSSDGFALLAAVKGDNLITPDTAYRTVDVGVFNPVYDLPDGLTGKTVTIKFTQTNEDDAIVRLAFLDSSGAMVSVILDFDGTQTEHEITMLVPDGVAGLGFKQATRTGKCTVKMESVTSGRKLPILQYGDDQYLQNLYMSFAYLQQFYLYDMPAKTIRIDGVEQQAYGIKKLKTQELKFPCYADPEPTELIRTSLGNGTIEKISVNLSSRSANATLKYDTE